jgi:hypothetical protein
MMINHESIVNSWWFMLLPALGILCACVGFFAATELWYIQAIDIAFLIINSIFLFMLMLNKMLYKFYLDLTIYDLERRIDESYERIRNTIANNNRGCNDSYCEKCD